MTEEAQVGFLFKAASSLPQTENNPAQTILKSYYLMRCREVAKDHGLPDKYFSAKVRCTHCFVEWNKDTVTKVQAIKLSKRQRKKIRCSKITQDNKDDVQSRKDILKSNKLTQICSFCKHSTITTLLKPSKPKLNDNIKLCVSESDTVKSNKEIPAKKGKQIKPTTVKPIEVNVYSKAKDVFSLSNKNNSLPSTTKVQKVIKNNKKKKDKFAGLCQQAVLASAKLKEGKNKQEKLHLFLKPST